MLKLNSHLLTNFSYCKNLNLKKFENLKQNLKKRTSTKKLIDIIKNDIQFNKLMNFFSNQSMKKITMKDSFNCFDAFQKLFFKRAKEKSDSMKIFLLKMKKLKMSKKTDISEFAYRFYTIEISKTIVFSIK